MVKQTIQIFVRIKPTKAKTGPFEIAQDGEGGPILSFQVPKEVAAGYINNKKENYKFRFQNVFKQNCKQDEVFESVAKPVIDNVLGGYNGTIFAYGQTGSGKTFTITGGAERFVDRGIIPRTLSYIFQHYQQNTDMEFTSHVSYLEIYNDSGYDLLDPKHEASKLEDLPKVALMEDDNQNIHLKNLSTHTASNEEEALNLLFLGDTNRMIAETPMNQASTRSHCIFTIHITSREPGSATIRRSKLHLVDLAGSERISKTGVEGQLMSEAKYINLSLHYLEQVIVALSEKSRSHIPYRNSMMTSVLRDSLGGNCMTSMIATCSVEKKNIDESISTCRFAQRVALIKNDALLNEELDPKLLIAKLKREVQQLKEELAMATGEQRTDELTDEDLERCHEAVERFMSDSDPDAVLNVGADMRKIHECCRILKRSIVERPSLESSGSTLESSPAEPVNTSEMKRIQDTLKQRDNEINILVNMLKKEKKRAADAIAALDRHGHDRPPSIRSRSGSEGAVMNGHQLNGPPSGRSAASPGSARRERGGREKPLSARDKKTQQKILGDLSLGRQEAFEIFRRDYGQNAALEEKKTMLKQRYVEAKRLGEGVNSARQKINQLKSSIEKHRMSRVMQGLVDPDNPEPDEIENDMRDQMEVEKDRYKDAFQQLRGLKSEIEHMQHLMEKSKMQLMKDFEIWWAEQAAHASSGPLQPHVRAAWRTPPLSPQVSNLASHNSQTSLHSEYSSRSSNLEPESSRTSSASDVEGHRSAPIPNHIRGSLGGRKHSGSTSGYSSQESSAHKSRGQRPSADMGGASIPLTGDAQADADIMAFLKARQNILTKTQQR